MTKWACTHNSSHPCLLHEKSFIGSTHVQEQAHESKRGNYQGKAVFKTTKTVHATIKLWATLRKILIFDHGGVLAIMETPASRCYEMTCVSLLGVWSPERLHDTCVCACACACMGTLQYRKLMVLSRFLLSCEDHHRNHDVFMIHTHDLIMTHFLHAFISTWICTYVHSCVNKYIHTHWHAFILTHSLSLIYTNRWTTPTTIHALAAIGLKLHRMTWIPGDE